MLQKLRSAWGKWRENSRQYKLDRAMDKAGRRGDTGKDLSDASEGARHGTGPPPAGGSGM
jgi:hypothetical protein